MLFDISNNINGDVLIGGGVLNDVLNDVLNIRRTYTELL